MMEKIFRGKVKDDTKEITNDNNLKKKKTYYIKLDIKKGNNYIGKRFKLFFKKKLIWGTEIERAPRGFQLEYRNIIGYSNNIEDYSIDIDIPYSLEFSEQQFLTKEQENYDKKYGIEKCGEFFLSKRGNLTNPQKIIFTFPGFGPSTTRIPYSVSYMSDMPEEMLENVAIIAFQDRYQVAGTYMLENDTGESLYPLFKKFVQELLEKYSLKESDLLFFGASKGGSIAILYMKDFVESTLVTSVPQINLLYYWQSKSFFRNNLFNYFKTKDIDKPIELLKKYFDDKRKIHYFYTLNDELSNYSFIELISGATNLSKYRVDGKHGEVTKKALTTINSIIKRFGQYKSSNQLISSKITKRYFDGNSQFRYQFLMGNELINEEKGDFWIVWDSSGTRCHQLMTRHFLKNVCYMNENQYLDFRLDDISNVKEIVATFDNGNNYSSKINIDEKAQLPIHFSENTLLFDSEINRYYVLEQEKINFFDYKFIRKNPKVRELKISMYLDNDDLAEKVKNENMNNSVDVLFIKYKNEYINFGIFLSRVMKSLNKIYFTISIQNSPNKFNLLAQILSMDLKNYNVELINPQINILDQEYLLENNMVKQLENLFESNLLTITVDSPEETAPYFKKLLKK